MQANRQSGYRHATRAVDSAYSLDAGAPRKRWLIAGSIAVSMLVGAAVGLAIMRSVGDSFVRQSDNGRFAPVDDTANYHGNEVESSKVASGTFDSCGRVATGDPRAKRVIGGHETDINNHPWQVSLWAFGRGHSCGGSIVSPRWVIFGAHCAKEYPSEKAWTAHVGRTRQQDDHVGQTSRCTDLIIHKEFTVKTYNKDVALLRLETELKYNDQVQPVCLPTSEDQLPPGLVCQISGWGAVEEGGLAVDHLRSVQVTVLDRKVCNRPDWLAGLVNQNMICAGTVDGSKDACQGDSGGPMTCWRSGRYFLRGTVSWGIGCGKAQMPGVYTDVARLNSWVRGSIVAMERSYGFEDYVI